MKKEFNKNVLILATMEITTHTKDLLVLEDKSWLARVFILSLAGAGLLLTMASMREYGFQAWYRLTHWFGVLMTVGGIISYTRIVFTLKLEISTIHQKASISRLKGFYWTQIKSFDPADISELKIERQTIGHREGFRLTAKIKDEWTPLQTSFSHDFMEVEQAAKVLQVALG